MPFTRNHAKAANVSERQAESDFWLYSGMVIFSILPVIIWAVIEIGEGIYAHTVLSPCRCSVEEVALDETETR